MFNVFVLNTFCKKKKTFFCLPPNPPRHKNHFLPAQVNFRKINLNNLECTYGCQVIEDQHHLFQSCEKLVSKDKDDVYDYIFEDAVEQKEAIIPFIEIERKRKDVNNAALLINGNIIPEGGPK